MTVHNYLGLSFKHCLQCNQLVGAFSSKIDTELDIYNHWGLCLRSSPIGGFEETEVFEGW